MGKQITFESRVQRGLMAGVDKLANTVKGTLGPKGRNVTMHQKPGLRGADYSDKTDPNSPILVTNDGVTIAHSIVLEDPVENMGAQFLKEVATKTNDEAGDGTTTATILAQSILHEGFKNVSAGANPIALQKGILKASDKAVSLLQQSAISISTREQLSKVAAISCEDKDLGDMVGEALDRVGLEGVVTVDDSHRYETTLDVMEGIVFERGFLSPVMTTDKNQTVCELHNPYILMSDKEITNPQDIIPALICAAEDDRPMLIISNGVSGEALGLIQQNKVDGDMDICCILAPLYGEGREWRMEDLAVQTGGVYITDKLGLDIRKVTRDMLGQADYVKVTKKRTVITGAKGDPEKVKKQVQELRYLVDHTDYEFNRKRYEERLAKFVSGVATIDVGGQTQTEIWERKARVEDAVNAARAAKEEGIVAGGGIAYLNILPKLQEFADTLEGDQRTGALTVVRALKSPARQIAENAGLDGASVLAHLLEQPADTGYDVDTDQYVNMLDHGIIDPVKVSRMALESACSVSATLLTVGAGISDVH